jgi:hypothetical protein
MTAEEELRETARRLLERDCAAQGIEAIVTDPAVLAEVAALLRPVTKVDPPAGGGDSRGRAT